MALHEYVLLPRDIVAVVRWIGVRGFGGLAAGAAVFAGLFVVGSSETGVFAGLLVFWVIAGYSGRVFFGFAITALIAIIGLSLYDAEFEVGETVLAERLAIWVFYLLGIGAIKLLIETVAGGRTRRTSRQAAHRKTPDTSEKRQTQATKETSKPRPKAVMPAQQSEPTKMTARRERLRSARASTRIKDIDTAQQSRAASSTKQPQPLRPVHPAYTPTKKRVRPRTKGPIQI